jgi:uncharacterized protein
LSYKLSSELISLSIAILLFLPLSWANAEPSFPKLTGRVVDKAGLLNPRNKKNLSAQLDAHENASSNQIVVAILKDLQGYSIEEFGYQLGRHWKIGQQDKDNGALLLFAIEERKVRIEVGYGLEGQLTDAISANIIHQIILPAFRKGQFDSGIKNGVTAMIEAVGGQYKMRQAKSRKQRKTSSLSWLFILPWIGFSLLGGRRRGLGSSLIAGGIIGGLSSGRGRGGGFSGGGFGGFSGGGGGFGGGGASGGW